MPDLALSFTPIAGGAFPDGYANRQKGGLHVAANTTDRNAIPEYLREAGMFCWVKSPGELYSLEEGPWGYNNGDWTPVTTGSGGPNDEFPTGKRFGPFGTTAGSVGGSVSSVVYTVPGSALGSFVLSSILVRVISSHVDGDLSFAIGTLGGYDQYLVQQFPNPDATGLVYGLNPSERGPDFTSGLDGNVLLNGGDGIEVFFDWANMEISETVSPTPISVYVWVFGKLLI